MGLCPSHIGKGHTYRNGRVLYTRQFHNYLPCGTNPQLIYLFQVTWRHAVRRIDGADQYHASIA